MRKGADENRTSRAKAGFIKKRAYNATFPERYMPPIPYTKYRRDEIAVSLFFVVEIGV
jgi:hypothetical protein